MRGDGGSVHLRRRAFIRLPPALERRLIGFPRSLNRAPLIVPILASRAEFPVSTTERHLPD